MFDIKLIAIASVIAFGVGSMSSAYITHKYKNAIFESKLIEQEREATRVLLAEQARNRQVEISLSQAKDKLELDYANVSKKNRTLNSKYIASVDAGKRLRDPNAGKSCGDGMSADSRSPARTAGNGGAGILSAEASRFLLNEASRADQVLTDLNLCKSWVRQVQKALKSR